MLDSFLFHYNENNLQLSDPILEPKITQEFILNNFLNSEYDIKIYNDEWIRLVDTQDLYEISNVEEVDIKEAQLIDNNINIYQYFTEKYLRLFNNLSKHQKCHYIYNMLI